MIRSLFLSFLLTLTGAAFAQTSYTIDVTKPTHTHQGWGVSLCWWASQCGRYDEQHLDSLITWMVSPEGLNYNIFRYNIGGGDDPQWRNCTPHHCGKGRGKGLRAEMEGFQDERGGAYQWQRDAGQLRVLRMIKARRPDAVFEAFSNSAPYWMTVSGCVAGHDTATVDNLRPDYYEDFAHYLVDVCQHIREAYGITFRTLEPFNEAITNYWRRDGGQEGCHFSSQAQADFLKVLHPVLQSSGLPTVISASDETHVATAVKNLRAYAEAGVLPLIGQYNTHTYGGSEADKLELRELCRQYGVPLWQSETGSGGKGMAGNLGLAHRLIEDVRSLQPLVWCDWQYVEQVGDQWCTVNADSLWQTYKRNRNYYVRQHFTKFIPVGYRFVPTTHPDALAALSPGGHRLVYVLLNRSEAEADVRTEVPQGTVVSDCYVTTEADWMQRSSASSCHQGVLTLRMAPQSIATVVMTLP